MGGTSDDDILGAHFGRMLVPPSFTRRIGNDDYATELRVSAQISEVRETALAVTRGLGQIITTDPEIVAKVGTGTWHLNPAVLRLRLSQRADGMTLIDVAATAKEGLIKQHGGHQAVDRFVVGFRELAPAAWNA